MIEIVRARALEVPAGRVWNVIEPVERLPDWFTGAESAVSLEGRGLGRRQRLSGRWGRHRFEIDQTVIRYEAGRALAWRQDAERLDGKPAPTVSRQVEFVIELQALDHRTRVTLTARHLPDNVLKAWLVRLVAAPRIARMMERSLDRLATLLETAPDSGARR